MVASAAASVALWPSLIGALVSREAPSLAGRCLPVHLREANAVITRTAAGLPAAGVYTGRRCFVLEVADAADEAWPDTAAVQRLAADAGVTTTSSTSTTSGAPS
jgi:hypothetical protein